jgi:hypothetical protein
VTPSPASLLFRAASLGALALTLGGLAAVAACGSDRGFVPDDTAGATPGPKNESTETDAAADAAAPDAADAAAPWPTCDAKPAGAPVKSIAQIWQADPKVATEAWVEGAYVTAVSGAACRANKACQIFLQSDLAYASLAAAAKHGIKVFVSAAVASYFTSVRVGDRVDVLGWAWRYDVDAQHELLLQVNTVLPGCAKTTSTGNALVPLAGVTLADLTLDRYENTHGPLLVRVASLLGKPDASPAATFGLFHANDGGAFDAGSDAGAEIVSLSPFMLPSSAFTGLAPTLTAFSSITGVFGTFVPASGAKYLEIYPRTPADLVVQ